MLKKMSKLIIVTILIFATIFSISCSESPTYPERTLPLHADEFLVPEIIHRDITGRIITWVIVGLFQVTNLSDTTANNVQIHMNLYKRDALVSSTVGYLTAGKNMPFTVYKYPFPYDKQHDLLKYEKSWGWAASDTLRWATERGLTYKIGLTHGIYPNASIKWTEMRELKEIE